MINQANQLHGRQRGGTIIGIIIGLIIGLGIAVGVAMAISKSTLPFLNKVAKQDKATELTPGQASDPNKPIYTNNTAAKEAAKTLSSTPGATPDAPQPAAPVDTVTPAPTVAPKPADAPKTAVPATTAAAATAGTTAATANNGEDKWMYYLQAGAFRDKADAENSKAKLALAGFEANISDHASDVGPLYRVRIGPFNQREAMNRAKEKLSDNGIDVSVVPTAK